MLHIDIGVSALRASQLGLHTVSNNIANANTEGYHRQRVDLVPLPAVAAGPHPIGSGVDVAGLSRLRDVAVEASLVSSRSLTAESEAILNVLRQMESALLPAQGSLLAAVSEFFTEVERLAGQPATSTLRESVMAAAGNVVSQLGQLDSQLNRIRTDLSLKATEDVQEVNRITSEIAELDRQVRILTVGDVTPNSLLDTRDKLVGELAQYVDISPQTLLIDGSPLVAAGGAVIVGEEATQVVAQVSPDGRTRLSAPGGSSEIVPLAGRLKGFLDAHDAIDAIQSAVHDWANTFVAAVDQAHALGRGLGPQSSLITGHRPIAETSIPLHDVDQPFPIHAGRWHIALTSPTTGERSLHAVDIDPSTDSLENVLSQLNSIPNLIASVQPDSHRLSLRTSDGSKIDFSGGVELAGTAGLSGTSVPELLTDQAATFDNQTWTVTFSGTGAVGVTAGLQATVTDSQTGASVAVVDLGPDYVPGELISLEQGVELAFGAGSVTGGETFTVRIVGNSDETGLLAALGVQSLFTGHAAVGIGVNPTVQQSPRTLAVSRTGDAADGSNLKRFIALRDAHPFAEHSETFEERLAGIGTAVGFRIQSEEAGGSFLEQQQAHLETARDAVSGVDPNEEILQMLEYQRMFQAASRFVSVIDQTLQELMRLIG